jgi:phage baseplate assembly protein V
MMNHLLNAIKAQAELQGNGTARNRMGIVTGYDQDNYSVKVELQPDGLKTGWLPLLSAWGGNGWGMFAPPIIGSVVEVSFIENDIESGFVNLKLFSDVHRPLSVQSGEFWLVHQNGALFKLLNNGAATLSDGHGAAITLNGDGTITSSASNWTHNGNVVIEGEVKTSGDITDTYHTNTRTIAGIRGVYNNHIHTDPQGGSVSTPTTGM